MRPLKGAFWLSQQDICCAKCPGQDLARHGALIWRVPSTEVEAAHIAPEKSGELPASMLCPERMGMFILCSTKPGLVEHTVHATAKNLGYSVSRCSSVGRAPDCRRCTHLSDGHLPETHGSIPVIEMFWPFDRQTPWVQHPVGLFCKTATWMWGLPALMPRDWQSTLS